MGKCTGYSRAIVLKETFNNNEKKAQKMYKNKPQKQYLHTQPHLVRCAVGRCYCTGEYGCKAGINYLYKMSEWNDKRPESAYKDISKQ